MRDCRISAAIAPASREPCSGLALAPRLRAGWVAVRRGTQPGQMALRALHLTQDRSLGYCAPSIAWAAQNRSDEGGGSLRAEGALSRRARAGPRAARRAAPASRALPGERPGRGPSKGRGFSALPMQRTTSPQARKKFTRKFLGGFVQRRISCCLEEKVNDYGCVTNSASWRECLPVAKSLTLRYRNLYL